MVSIDAGIATRTPRNGDLPPTTFQVTWRTKALLVLEPIACFSIFLIIAWQTFKHGPFHHDLRQSVVDIIALGFWLYVLVIFEVERVALRRRLVFAWLRLDSDCLRACLPSMPENRYPGPLCALAIPYGRIHAVERREECYPGLIPSILTAYTLISQEGERITLGLTPLDHSELAYEEAANAIARRIGRPIVDAQAVLAPGQGWGRRYRPPPDARALEPSEVAHWRKLKRSRLILGSVALGTILLVLWAIH
jgi:hypothetical protein